MEQLLSQQQIRQWLRANHYYKDAGDEVPMNKDIVGLAGVSRQTLWNLVRGERISEQSQIRLSVAIRRLEAEKQGGRQTRLWSVQKGPGGLTVRPGLSMNPLLRSR